MKAASHVSQQHRQAPADAVSPHPAAAAPWRAQARQEEIARLSAMGLGVTAVAALLKCRYGDVIRILDRGRSPCERANETR